MALPSSGPISLGDVRTELGLNGSISLGQKEVRDLAGISNGSIGLDDLKGKSVKPWFADTVDYYFETIEDFNTRRDQIIAENNGDLINKTFGFSDNVTSFIYAFEDSDIISTPKAIYGNNITSFNSCFTYCRKLITISENLFNKCYNVTDFRECFSYCFSLLNIPENLFNNCLNADMFGRCFKYCEKIIEIPENLFKNNIKATLFNHCFDCCNSLTSVPENLFYNCPNAIDFMYCFAHCDSLITIPKNLFSNCFNVDRFEGCFYYCSSLTTIPEGLFDDCPNVINFKSCFESCKEITSALPDVWNKEKFPNVTNGNYYAAYCTKSANYNEIPNDFK